MAMSRSPSGSVSLDDFAARRPRARGGARDQVACGARVHHRGVLAEAGLAIGLIHRRVSAGALEPLHSCAGDVALSIGLTTSNALATLTTLALSATASGLGGQDHPGLAVLHALQLVSVPPPLALNMAVRRASSSEPIAAPPWLLAVTLLAFVAGREPNADRMVSCNEQVPGVGAGLRPWRRPTCAHDATRASLDLALMLEVGSNATSPWAHFTLSQTSR